jgi:predicted esterase
MQWMSPRLLSLCFLCFCGSFSGAASSEIDRFDLGQRLIQLEGAWSACPDAAARARALPVVKLAVPHLFAGRMAEAAAALDRARLLLETAQPTAADTWAASLLLHSERRLIDPAAGPLAVRVASAYSAGEPPAGVTVRLGLVAADGSTRYADTVVPFAAPIDISLAIDKAPEGDHTLRAEVAIGEKVRATYSAGVSVVPRLAHRIDRLTGAVWGFDAKATEAKTLASSYALLRALAHRIAPETNYPAARLLAETEALAKAVTAGERFYGPKQTGQFWLTLANANTAVRLFIPEQANQGKPLPVVVALHGAGGSENMFFDAYGCGLIARLAKDRGWMVVAPRSGWLFDAAPPVGSIVDELANLYPVDRQRIFVVGHSMGAMQAVTLAEQGSTRLAAIAVLAGGSSAKPEALRDLPVFIGCGGEDFLLGGSKRLAESLKKAKATLTTYKEYPGIEHLLIVQEALPDVFKFFASARPE